MNVGLLDSLLVGLAFEAPVRIDDITPIWNALRDCFPESEIEIYFHTGKVGDEVVISVDDITRKVAVV